MEGGEAAVLAGAQRLLESARPCLIIELHGPQAAADAWRQLVQARYRMHRLDGGLTPINTLGNLEWKTYVLARPQERAQEELAAQ